MRDLIRTCANKVETDIINPSLHPSFSANASERTTIDAQVPFPPLRATVSLSLSLLLTVSKPPKGVVPHFVCRLRHGHLIIFWEPHNASTYKTSSSLSLKCRRSQGKGHHAPPTTPNTLTVQIPFGPAQSLPTSPSSSSALKSLMGGGGDAASGGSSPSEHAHSHAHHHHHAHHVPNKGGSGRSKSPTARGISYPPISPKSLKRGVAIQSSASIQGAGSPAGVKNPPLIKSRHVVSAASIMEPAASAAGAVGPMPQPIPVITGTWTYKPN